MGINHQPMAVFQGTNVQNGGHHVAQPPFSMQQLQHMHMMNNPAGTLKNPEMFVVACIAKPYPAFK